MGAWETDDEYLSGPAATSLPTPQDTPYRTPSSASRRSRRSATPPGKGKSKSPPREKGSRRSSRDLATDETISILDPRRFTPTLHANLVSEILALRRDQEEKIKLIETLELSLHTTREERETLQQNLANTGKESRSLKRQLSLLEGGTSSALGELARERDEAVESIADTKKRLEAAQKKIRTQEEDSQRVHELLAEEKETWEEEKRKYERKIHVAESRLKVVLDEVAAYQAAQAQHVDGHGLDSEAEESGRENDGASIRTMSMTNSVRFSVMTGPGSMRPNGNSLADELNFDDDEQSDMDGRDSALSNYHPYVHSRNFSRDSVMSRMHRRNQSLESLKRSGSVARSRLFMNQSVLEALEGEEEEIDAPVPKTSYVDSGIQYSPPPSPKLTPSKPSTPEPILSRSKSPEVEYSPRTEVEIEANQSRKRVHVARPLSIEPITVRKLMVSTSSQTLEDPPLTPPKTPKSPTRPPPSPPIEIKKPEMATSSTQTDAPQPAPLTRSFVFPPMPPSPPLAIPSISVHPPTSRPTTPREPRLPQHFKDFGCQVSILAPVATSEAGVQTEGIQIDKRLALLPTHLQPSSITSRPSSPNPPLIGDPPKAFTPVPGNVPPRNPRRLTKRDFPDMPSSPISIADSEPTHDAYPGNNDDGPLSNQKAPMRRPHRFSSLFAGFDGASSDEVDEFGEYDMSDSEYRTALSAPRPKSVTATRSKRSSTGTVTTNGTIPGSPEQITMKQVSRGSVKPFANDIMSYFSGDKEKEVPVRMASVKSGRIFEKSPAAMSSNRASVMRKAAMIQSGIASHQGRSRSPSLQDAKNPPFPIPTRASSRKVPFSSSVPSDGQRSPTRGEMLSRRGSRSHYRSGSIRKVRSAAALPRNQRYRRQGSRSPPPLSPSTEAPESPALPPLPRNDITTPLGRPRQYRHQHQLSVTTDNTMSSDPPHTNSGSVNSSSQNNTVVDAIAQTMVGEWMFKYVRRRKSFGVPDTNRSDENSNDRHKRWVWLAPYERSILWSSKQPSSGSALMGKTGRKLVIQSVLDVKDDNPTPRGTPSLFNRSILILTPQRALKFTATSAERHYIWLTALSFLAHSSQALPENISQPQISDRPAPLPEFEMPKTKLKRGGIRDSIRLAKGRHHLPKAAPPSIPSIPSAPSSQMGDVLSFSMVDSVGMISSNHSRDGSADAAEPPMIPRFHERNNPAPPGHGRKRSNTGGHVPPPLSFRGFSGPAGTGHHAATNSTAGASIGTAGSSDIYQSQASSTGTWGMSMSQTASQRTSEASSRPSNFFDAIGTVRMEAFISPLAFSQFNDYPDEQDEFRQEVRRRSKEHRRRQSRSRHRDSYSSRGTRGTGDYYGSRTVGEEDFFRDDPFKGF